MEMRCDNGAMKMHKKGLPDTWEPLSCGENEIINPVLSVVPFSNRMVGEFCFTIYSRADEMYKVRNII